MTLWPNILRISIAATLLVCGSVQAAGAGEEVEKVEKLQVTVLSVTGQAEKLLSGQGQEWTALKAGEKLDELTIIRTSLRTKVVLKFADRGQTVVGSGTQLGIGEFRKTKGNLVVTRLGLKYGRLSVAVDSSRAPNDYAIVTPVATLSVRGTKGDIFWTGRQVYLYGSEGTWHVAVDDRSRHVVAGESTDGNLTPSIDLTKDRDANAVVMGVTDDEWRSARDNPNPANPTGPSDLLPRPGKLLTLTLPP